MEPFVLERSSILRYGQIFPRCKQTKRARRHRTSTKGAFFKKTANCDFSLRAAAASAQRLRERGRSRAQCRLRRIPSRSARSMPGLAARPSAARGCREGLSEGGPNVPPGCGHRALLSLSLYLSTDSVSSPPSRDSSFGQLASFHLPKRRPPTRRYVPELFPSSP